MFLSEKAGTTLTVGVDAQEHEAVTVELFETKASNILPNDGVSTDVAIQIIATSDLRVGAGIAANLQKADLVKVDFGLYATKAIVDLLDADAPIQVTLNLGAQLRF